MASASKRLKRIRLADILIFVLTAGFLCMAGFFSKATFGGLERKKNAAYNAPVIELRDRMYGIAAPGDGVVWIAGNYGKIARSEDGGASWSVQRSPVRYTLQDIDAWDKKRAVAVGNNGVVIYTENGGSTWLQGNAPRSDIVNKLFKVRTGDDGQAWAVGVMGMIIFTEDWGKNWRRLREEEDIAWNDIALIDGSTALVIGEFGRMIRSSDGGTTWEDVESPVEKSLMGMSFLDQSNGVAVGLDGLVLRTSDAGQTWVLVDSGTTEHLFDVIWDGRRWVAVGSNGVLAVGEETTPAWKSQRLSAYERGWHTEIAKISTELFLVGRNQGRWAEEEWSYLGRQE